jgi:hypothetical protein
MRRCPTCGRLLSPDHPLLDAVIGAQRCVEQARRTTHPDELARHTRNFERAADRARVELDRLKQHIDVLRSRGSRGAASERPPEYQIPPRRRDPPTPEFKAMAQGRYPPAQGRLRLPYHIPGRPSWPDPPPPEWRELRQKLSDSPEPR